MTGNVTKIAILGAGISSLSAAYELARQQDAAGNPKFDITIYQMGWRIGGKLATSRNEDKGYRIEEHGIHGFMGSYYNAGSMMGEVFKDLAKIEDLEGFYTDFEHAFTRQKSAVMWEYINQKWTPWPISMPANNLSYGDVPAIPPEHQGVLGMLALMIEQIAATKLNGWEMALFEAGLKELVGFLEKEEAEILKLGEKIVNAANKIRDFVRPALEQLDLEENGDIRHAFVLIDFACSTLTGFFADDIPKKGYASINDEDYRAWMKRHGAAQITLDSPFTLNTADITYNFPGGDTTQYAQMGAGCFLQWSLRLVAYVGTFVLPFRAGSGETVLAPLYRALKEFGVKFEFFHKVENLALSEDKSKVASIKLGIQATVKAGTQYEPLIPVEITADPYESMLMCWPSHPQYDQLDQGAELKTADVNLESWWTPWKYVAEKNLVAGEDFDHVVLGISLGGLPYICQELIDDESNLPLVDDAPYKTRWKTMVEEIDTVQTQAMQIWCKDDMKAHLDQHVKLPNNDEWIAGTFAAPIQGQGDFSSLIGEELWPEDGPKGIFYLCGPKLDSGIPDFSDVDYPTRQSEVVKSNCISYLQSNSGPMLPGASIDAGLDFECLYDPEDRSGALRFDYQFWRANIDPTERYVTCLPNAVKYRLEAWQSGYSNLSLTGDWINTGLNVGSVEGAVMGGKLASYAISESPSLDNIYGYDPFGTN